MTEEPEPTVFNTEEEMVGAVHEALQELSPKYDGYFHGRCLWHDTDLTSDRREVSDEELEEDPTIQLHCPGVPFELDPLCDDWWVLDLGFGLGQDFLDRSKTDMSLPERLVLVHTMQAEYALGSTAAQIARDFGVEYSQTYLAVHRGVIGRIVSAI